MDKSFTESSDATDRAGEMKLNKLAKRFRIDKPAHFHLSDYDPADTGGLSLDKHSSEPMLADSVARLAGLQPRGDPHSL